MHPDHTSPRTVTAIVVGYNHAHCLGRCFDSLMGQQGLDHFEVFYIDNASDDSSAAMSSRHPEIHVIRNTENVGFSRAVNQGLRLATGRYVALVNPDTQIDPLTIRVLVDALQHRPRVGLVGPRLIDEEGKTQQSLAPYPDVVSLLERLGRRSGGPNRSWLIGAFLVAEADVLRELQGLDESFFLYGEDMDLSYRLQRAGREVWLESGTHITHTGNPRWSADRLLRIYSAYVRFISLHFTYQHLPLGLLFSLRWLLRGTLAGASVAQLLGGVRTIWSDDVESPPERCW